MQNYQVVVIHSCPHEIHKGEPRSIAAFTEIHTDVERSVWKKLRDQ